jgi:acyl-CoA reductase-like NAD-dependent aldehyde dehydrogenase
VPIAERKACIARFRAAVTAGRDAGETLDAEVGKPIRSRATSSKACWPRSTSSSRRPSAASPPRPCSPRRHAERISHEPLGVVANISAWNYPYFVGCNVFVPALLTGNAVLYKPSEYATLTGLHIARLLHERACRGRVHALVGGGDVGAALLEQRIDGLFFTGSHATGARIAAALGPRLVKLQLELGGKDPTTSATTRRAGGRRVAGRRRDVQHRPELLLGRAHLRARAHPRRLRRALRRRVRGFKLGDPLDETPTSARSPRAPQIGVLERQVADATGQGREAARRRASHRAAGAVVRTNRDDRGRPHHGADARGKLRPRSSASSACAATTRRLR